MSAVIASACICLPAGRMASIVLPPEKAFLLPIRVSHLARCHLSNPLQGHNSAIESVHILCLSVFEMFQLLARQSQFGANGLRELAKQ